LQSEPPRVDVAKQRATDFLPVRLGVFSAGNGKVLSRAADGPSGLGDPNILSSDGFLGSLKSIVEKLLSTANTVGHAVLEVWIRVESNPVAVLGNGRVRAVDP